MRVVTLPKGHFPYVTYCAARPTRRKPSLPQQRILDQMQGGAWYEAETADRHGSCRALVGAGWCEMARVARKDKQGNLVEPSPEQMLLDRIMGRSKDQPVEMYRVAKPQKGRG
jgi:hypothetical protein